MSFCLRKSLKLLRCYTRASSTLAEVRRDIENFENSGSKFVKILKNRDKINNSQWPEFREELKNNFKNQNVVDAKIFNILAAYQKYNDGINYFKFLKCNNYPVGLSVIGHYFKMYWDRYEPLTAKEEEDIIKEYDELRKNYPLLDKKTCNCCILALSLTKRWKDSFELLDMIKISSKPGTAAYSAIISAAFRNNEVTLGWTILQEQITDHVFRIKIYDEYIDYCYRNFKNINLEESINKMLNYWRTNLIQPPQAVTERYVKAYEELGYSSTSTSVSGKGICYSCNHQLSDQISLSKEDFQKMSKSILQNVIIGENIFHNSSPQELKRYLLLIQTLKPYDVVIDGLNVAYSRNKQNQPGSIEKIIEVVDLLKEKENKKEILVIGRAHMNWWKPGQMEKLKRKADVFLTKNISMDDGYLLHVSLMSGPQTYFVSNDLMRQHKFKINKDLQKLFKQWQLSRQYMFSKDSRYGNAILHPPLTFGYIAQQDKNGWHVPYVTHANSMLKDSYSKPDKWICLKKKF